MQITKNVALKTLLTAAALASPMAFAAGEDAAAAGMDAAKTAVLTMIGLGVAAGFALLAASLAPDVGLSLTKKWIKKGAK